MQRTVFKNIGAVYVVWRAVGRKCLRKKCKRKERKDKRECLFAKIFHELDLVDKNKENKFVLIYCLCIKLTLLQPMKQGVLS